MASRKVTGTTAASKAGKTLVSTATGGKSKTAAASALSQKSSPVKVTSPKAATAASKVLKDGRTSKTSKSAAASALAQTPSQKKSK